MAEDNKREAEEENQLQLDDEKIRSFIANPDVIAFLKKLVPRLKREGIQKLIRLLLYQSTSIVASELTPKPKTFIRYNLSKFDKNGKMKVEASKVLRLRLMDYLREIGKDIELSPSIKQEEGSDDTYMLDKNSNYEQVRNLICDEGGEINFIYDFNNPDMKQTPPLNKATLQFCQIQITSTSITFDYPIEYRYNCFACGHRQYRKAYNMISSKTRYKCEGVKQFVNPQTGQPKTKICGEVLYPEGETSLTKNAYFYDINFDDENSVKQSANGLSFKKYDPGFYDCVLFKVNNPTKRPTLIIIDVKQLINNKMEIPINASNENYLITLQKGCDKFIKQQTGMNVYGLFPIKVALIIQYIISVLKMRLVCNIQLVGDSSTGKSTVLKFYGFLLSNQFNLSTNGLSISVAALRGTKQSIILMGKEEKIVTLGYLGTFKTIHIDEAGENKQLVQNLKTFLLEENYGYDRAGATGIFNERTAQINISENLDYNHLGQYQGSIRKAYKEMNTKISDEEQVQWDERWDLHKPIFEYTNPYLRKVISEKRTELKNKQIFWIDGYEWPLHERFPFYFYLTNEKKDERLGEVVMENVSRETIRENLELIKVLKNEELIKTIKLMDEYKKGENDVEGFLRVDEILEQYGIEADVRMKEFYYLIIKISRMANMRKIFTEEDYNLLRWFLEKTNCKLDTADTVDYKIVGPPDIKAERQKDLKIEEESRSADDEFGLPSNEFD